MAKIQNPQNQRGETLATEQNVKTSFENLSNSINDIKYFISTLENDTLPASINLELNVNTDLKASEPSEDQIVSAPAAKNYVDHELDTVIKTKTEALPNIYTGDNMFYVNCYGFEYTNPSENIIFDKIEIKFAKNLDTLTKFRPGNAPEISPLEIENNICKIVVAKVKTPAPGVYEQPPASDEIEIATSNYNTNISKEVNLSQFKFSENILLEEGWNYRFYFYDKNDNLFPASVIVNFVVVGDTTLRQSSVANRYLSERYDYWGVHGVKQDNNTKVLNGLGIKLINSLQEHVNNEDIHVTADDKNNWNTHVNNDIRHFKEGEHEQLFSEDQKLFATSEELATAVESLDIKISDINNELETYNYDLAQSVETGDINNNVNNTRGFATLITDNITLAKVITYCHPSSGTENANIWLKVFEKTTAPHIFKGISDTSLNHVHDSNLEYTFKNSDIKLEANKEYFFVFCPDSQKNSTTFDVASDSADCCIKTVANTTGHGGVLGSNAVSKRNVIALHKIYKKLGKFAFAFANDLEEHTANDSIHVTNDEKNNWNTSNIDYKALNKDVASYKDGVLTYGDGATENINLEKAISAQYAFGKYSDSSAATISEFNPRTIKNDYTINDGANYENDCVVSDDEAVYTLANLINGRGMFLRSNLTTFNDELPCLMLGDVMFKDSKSLSNFRSPLPSLTCAAGMFRGCTKLTTFRTKLPSLSRAKSMFNDDSELTIVDTCLPSLTYGNNMFSNCPKLTTVNLSSTSLSNLYDGTFMFHCDIIRDFNKFKGDLSSLETAEYMFTGCRLDLESVTRIADTIRDWSDDSSSPCEHRIGIGINSKSNWTDWNKFEEQKTRIINKGWVIAQWDENGVDPEESTALTYYYAKPAFGYASPEYIDENGNEVTLILTHYTDCKDEYEIVSSREEAEIRFNLTKIEKN